MGNYVTSADVVGRLGTAKAAQLTTDSGAAPDMALINQRIAEAEGEVNSYLAKRAAVPIDLVTHTGLAASLRGLTMDLVIERLHRRRPPVPEDDVRARKAAIDWLEKVAAGKVNLPASVTPASTNADDPQAAHGNYRDDAGHESMI